MRRAGISVNISPGATLCEGRDQGDSHGGRNIGKGNRRVAVSRLRYRMHTSQLISFRHGFPHPEARAKRASKDGRLCAAVDEGRGINTTARGLGGRPDRAESRPPRPSRLASLAPQDEVRGWQEEIVCIPSPACVRGPILDTVNGARSSRREFENVSLRSAANPIRP